LKRQVKVLSEQVRYLNQQLERNGSPAGKPSKGRYRLRYCGRTWRGPEWAVERKTLFGVWTIIDYVYGSIDEARTEMKLYAEGVDE
jgi:hypothetical protein